MRVAVLGAGGVVGRAFSAASRSRGVEVVDATDTDAPVLLSVAGGDLEVTRPAVLAALSAGRSVVDVDHRVGHVRWLHGDPGDLARQHDAIVLAAAGVRFAIGDLLVALAADLLPAAEAAHVAYTSGGGRTVLTPGERRSVAAGLGEPAPAVVQGSLVDEQHGEHRRLAWFPRPVGPCHAASVPGAEAITVPRHLPELTTIRSYQALGGWRAEVRQARESLARTERGRRMLQARLLARSPAVAPEALADQRWGCVAEVVGDGQLARAWAYGTDPVGVTAHLALEFVLLAADRAGHSGAVAPAELGAPAEILDAVADRSRLHWSRNLVSLAPRPAEGG